MERISNRTKENNPKTFMEVIRQIESQGLPNLLIVDLDGVLVEISPKIFLEGLSLYLLNKEKFQKYIQKHKIPLAFLRKLAELADKTKIVILTNRILRDKEDHLKNIFPFISSELVEKFKEKFKIEVIAQAFKPTINQQLEELASCYEKIIYIGSSQIDKFTAKRLKKINPNITYFQVGKTNLI